MIDRIKVFNDDWSAPEPPYPNSCKDDDEFCSQVAYDFSEGEVVTFVVSHYKTWDAYKFNENYIPLSFCSSVPGEFYLEVNKNPNLPSTCGDVTVDSPEQITEKCVENIVVPEGAFVEGNGSYGVEYFPSGSEG